eukprot:3348683-Alexandrium_andersonii.AAC.1
MGGPWSRSSVPRLSTLTTSGSNGTVGEIARARASPESCWTDSAGSGFAAEGGSCNTRDPVRPHRWEDRG